MMQNMSSPMTDQPGPGVIKHMLQVLLFSKHNNMTFWRIVKNYYLFITKHTFNMLPGILAHPELIQWKTINKMPHHASLVLRKPDFCICKKKGAVAQLISTIVFATYMVQLLYFVNLTLQAFSNLLWLYSPV